MIIFTYQQGLKTEKVYQNNNHAKYNQTGARTFNPGLHGTGIKNKNKENNLILYSAWFAVVHYDEENFDDGENREENDTNDKKNYSDDYECKKMDENKLADILQYPDHL